SRRSSNLEIELAPSRPPVVRARDDGERARHLDAAAVAVLLEPVGGREVDLDLRRAAGLVRPDGRQVLEGALGGVLDHLARAHCGEAASAEAAEPDLHLRCRQAVAEQRTRLATGGAVA